LTTYHLLGPPAVCPSVLHLDSLNRGLLEKNTQISWNHHGWSVKESLKFSHLGVLKSTGLPHLRDIMYLISDHFNKASITVKTVT
jgi:hypothetical protein